jgi:hypothetical protein
MVVERDQWAMSTLLADGRVLVTGGVDYSVLDSPYLSSAEIYDPATGVWSKTGPMVKGRGGHTATLLKNGKVLIAGGCDNDNTAELFDPGTNAFSTLGKMAVSATCGSTATLLPNGSVLLEGGASTGVAASKLAEIYDPATGRFSRTGSMATARSDAQAVLLGDGRVLVAGGDQESDNEVDLNSAEIYNPATGKFTEAGYMETPRTQFSATLLGNGSVLVAGGSNVGQFVNSAELYEPATNTFRATGSMTVARASDSDSPHTIWTTLYTSPLADGRVLFVGGDAGPGTGGTAEIYDPTSGEFSAIASPPVDPHPLSPSQYGIPSVTLKDGRVLIPGAPSLLYTP